MSVSEIDPVIHMRLRMRAAAMKDVHPAWCWAVGPWGEVCVADEHGPAHPHTWQLDGLGA